MWLIYRKNFFFFFFFFFGVYNIGISFEKSKEKGIYYFSTGEYTEKTYKKNNGFSVGGGIYAENSQSTSKKINIKSVKPEVGFYHSNYTAEDKFRIELSCNNGN